MLRNLIPLIERFLWLHGAVYNSERLALLINSHPDTYSLNNITDAFDDLGIPNTALEIDADQLQALPLPVITLVTLKGKEQYAIIKARTPQAVWVINEALEDIHIPYDDFYSLWHKAVVVAEVNNNSFIKKIREIPNGLLYAFCLSVLIFTFFQSNDLPSFIYNLISLAGIALTIIIFLAGNGNTSIAHKFCADNDTISCTAVLSSDGSRLFNKIKLWDLSMVYFATLFLQGILGKPFSWDVMLLFSSTALLIVPYSVFYQWRIIKKWCLLCLYTVVVLVVQFGVAAWCMTGFHYQHVYGIVPVLPAVVIAIIAWLLFKRVYIRLQEGKAATLEAFSFKRNYQLFLTAWEKQDVLPVAGFRSPVSYGNPEADLTIIVVSNPFCKPCAEAHAILNEVLRMLPGQVYIQYLFYFDPAKATDQRITIARQLVSLCLEAGETKRKEIIDQWYEKRQIAKQPALERAHLQLTNGILELFYKTRVDSHIVMSPTIIINGRKIPPPYYTDCLPWLLPYCVNSMSA